MRVLDASGTIPGQFCARMLADYGAAVTLLEYEGASEPQSGQPNRREGRTNLFQHLNRGKAVLQVPAENQRAEILARASDMDVVIVSKHALAEAVLAKWPHCVVSVITDAGRRGERVVPFGTEMIYQALSGMMQNNGDYGRPPLYGVGHRASYAAGLVAYIAIMAALIAKAGHGKGQIVETEVVEVAASMCFPYVMQYIYNGSVRGRADQRQPICPVRCRDGWVCIWIYHHLFAHACQLLDRPDLIDDPRFAKILDRQNNWSDFVAIMGEQLADRDSEELVAYLQANRIIAAKTYRPTELLAAGHLRKRAYWRKGADGEVALGPQFRINSPSAAAGVLS